ncbi:MAG: uroporphyrinogen-III C-methyltransferase [Gemmatimonadota bacterium]|nr:uroporphyrinogen-III C-methyltransferase [Gemmatimonadota bacterium]MDE2832085.1 uroporphyrinogen-III C-methyltransferase [Gemmatimonadota bacterium]
MKTGRVYLIGAGPGDPELITVKGLRLIREADIILYDGLANPELLKEARRECECINVEKRPGFQRVQQDEINQMMVDFAKKGLMVVRLKGGDPIVFGRGGEEAEVLRDHEIPFEIVPGITSAIAAPAYAGIPVTHRGISPHVTIVTGTTASLEGDGEVDWEGLAKVGGTLLILMGTRKRSEIARRLIAGGRSPETPVAAVQWGSLPLQRTVKTTLGEMDAVEMANPAVIVVGKVAAMDLDWFASKPLFGKTIAVTRARTQASELVQMLRALGAQVLEVPTIAFAEPQNWRDVDCVLADVHSYDWLVLTSTNGTDRFFERLFKQDRDVRALGEVKIATIGAATSDRVHEWRLNVDLEAANRTSEGLLADFSKDLSGQRFLLPRPEKSRDVLANKLRERGGEVREVVVYKTVMPECLPEKFLQLLRQDAIDLVAFTSSSTVLNLVSLLKKTRQDWESLPSACIGPITAQTAVAQGFDVVVELDETSVSISGLVKAILTHFR